MFKLLVVTLITLLTFSFAASIAPVGFLMPVFMIVGVVVAFVVSAIYVAFPFNAPSFSTHK